jgi:hypothetical protein
MKNIDFAGNAIGAGFIFFLYADSPHLASHSYPPSDSFAAIGRDGRRVMSERLSKIWAAAISAWRTLRPKHPPRYRREAHYMRGPGPAWRAKHTAVSGQR